MFAYKGLNHRATQSALTEWSGRLHNNQKIRFKSLWNLVDLHIYSDSSYLRGPPLAERSTTIKEHSTTESKAE